MTVAQDIATVSNNTVMVHGRKMEANSLLNIPSVAKSHGIKDLRNKFHGMPAVVAGAGPSLDAAMPILRAYQGKYILIAVDRALKPLLEHGITPHIVCTSDMDLFLKNFFTGFAIPDSVALVYDRDCYFGVPQGWKGPLITYDLYFDTGIWSTTFLGHRGFLCKNFTVSHTALYIAATMGCENVILTGVDFAYPSVEKHHASGAVENPLEPDEKARAHWVDIPGNVLPIVHTTEVFGICVPTMGSAIEESGVKCWNTSPIGAKIPQAPFMALEDAMAHLGRSDDYASRIMEYLAPPQFDLHAFGMQSRFVIKAMDTLLMDVTEGIQILTKLKKIDGLNNKTLFTKWRKVFLKSIEIRDKVLADTFSQHLLQRAMLWGVVKTKQALEPVKDLPPLNPKRLEVDCKRHGLLFWQLGENAKLFIRCLQMVRREFGLAPVETQWMNDPDPITV